MRAFVVANLGGPEQLRERPVDIAPSTLSHHFRVLREAGIIHQSQRGTRRWTSLRSAEFDERFPGLLQAVMAQER
ncbi:hypothetical protein Acsp03_65620 [Actinomadura sp. NBRC 104412]|uniref:ArsR/SmtB family transcription factor n=1 Tax=Actinomadura sp. NBRC 104412 TaxID=3032203 RepID=UPI0024A055BF|nr:helix-turn-helix domain-containing protein [Actinomadura sp. NBRC 104412]GLZ09096.1 hypothetical protein Acsp03_65620 [Actinomadura sp. NBRC 104412]